MNGFFLDENLSRRLRRAIRERIPDAVIGRVGDLGAPELGTPDPDILAWCETHQLCLVTRNRASMPFHLRDHLAEGRHVPGIFILRPNITVWQLVSELELIWRAARPGEYADQITYVPL